MRLDTALIAVRTSMSSLSAARARMSVSHTLFTSSEGAVVVFALSTTHWRWEGRFDEAGKNNLKNLRPLWGRPEIQG
jgi:hypothetical protein